MLDHQGFILKTYRHAICRATGTRGYLRVAATRLARSLRIVEGLLFLFRRMSVRMCHGSHFPAIHTASH